MKIIELFLRLIPAQVEALSRPCSEGDAEQLKTHAHKLKGSFTSIGAPRLTKLCGQLEERARAGQLESAPQLVAKIRENMERVTTKLIALQREDADAAKD